MSANNARRILFQIRRFHSLLGMFLLVELWIFALSGLMLNHPLWEVSQFWGRRDSVKREVPLPSLSAGTDEERASALKQALGVSGELESLSWSSKSNGYSLNIVRPARITTLSVDLDKGVVAIEEVSTDFFGFVSMLHTFNGVDFENGGRERDWIATTLWTATMDLLSVSLIFWVLSGTYLWIATGRRDRLAGSLAIAVGLVLGLFFLVAPAWF